MWGLYIAHVASCGDIPLIPVACMSRVRACGSPGAKKNLHPMKGQKVPLVAIERLRLRRQIGIHPHPFQRTNVRHPRDEELAVVVKADEPPVKQVIRTGSQEQPIGALQPRHWSIRARV